MHRLVVLLISVFVATGSAHAEGALDGNWKLTTIGSAAESVVAILKVETKDGKPAASVAFSPPNVECTITHFELSDTTVTATIRQTRTIQGRANVYDMEFVGVLRKDAKEILGSTRGSSSDDRFRTRAKLVATDKITLAADELIARTPLPEPMQKVQELNTRSATLMRQAQLEKDADKKKEATEQAQAARKEAEEQIPGLYREVVAKHAHFTRSTVAQSVLSDWPRRSAQFTKIMPTDYQRVLTATRMAKAEGRDVDTAIMEASRG